MAIFASDIQRTILEYYGENSTIWQRMQTGQATEQEIIRALGNAPQVQPVYSVDGNHVLGYDWAEPRSADLSSYNFIVENADSNSGQYGYSNNGINVNIPSNWGGSSGNYTVNSGATLASTGSRLATIADKASLAVTGVNIGAKLGAAIDGALYSLDPEWWDTHYPTINPQTWTSLATSTGGEQFIRTLFGIPQVGQTTAYVDERVIAQTYQMLRDAGVFSTGEESYSVNDTTGLDMTGITQPINVGDSPLNVWVESTGTLYRTFEANPNDVILVSQFNVTNSYTSLWFSRNPFTIRVTRLPSGNYRDWPATSHTTTIKGTTFTYYYSNAGGTAIETGTTITNLPSSSVTPESNKNTIAYILFYGDHHQTTPVDGITPIGGTWQYPPTNITGTDLDTVLQQLKTNYPQLFDDAITYGTLQPDGTIEMTTAVPVPWAVTEPEAQPVTKDETEITTKVDDKVLVDIATKTELEDKITAPTDTGEGTSETVVMPTGSASSLWAVYHPSQAELNAFGAWLWSSDFVDQLKRLFNDPMQAIIGVHKVFAPIPTGGSQTIKCGYLDSGVSSPTVSSQYTDVNCGTVSVSEYFGNVFDYDPHTKISLYLPFIGVVPLKTSEVMRSSVNVTYGVDVITGACLAKVRITRDGAGGILYSYGGSCACHYPISSGSYAGIISGVVTSAIGIAGGIATGNPLAAIGGAVAGLHQAHTEVQRSGGFTGCAGAMGPKKPFLIIDRPQTRMATDVEKYSGKPSNTTQFIGDCTGFVRATEVHFSAPGAFDDEAKEIEALLKSGVLISD